MKPKRTDYLFAGFAVALVLIGGVAWFDWRHTHRAQETADVVAHTHSVQAGLNRLLSLIEDIETGTRGFVITGDPAFLDVFKDGLGAVAEQQRNVRQMIDDPEQKASLLALEPLIAERIALAQRNTELRRNLGFEPAREAVASGAGKAAMDKVRARLAQMDARQQTLLDQRSAAARQDATTTRLLTITGIGLSLALLVAVFALVLRENRLRQRAQEQLDRFFTLSLDMLCIASADGYFKRISPAFTQTLGWSVDEILARPFLDFVHPDDSAATLLEVERQVVRGEKVLQFENRYRHKDGSWRVLSWKSVPQAGGLMYATARDVTERNRAEEEVGRLNAQLRADAGQLEAANRELESFAYSVSHDLRAPLRGMDGFSQAVLEDYADKLDATGQDYLRRIRAGAQRMGQLIDDLLSLSQVTRSDMVLDLVDLTALAHKVVSELRSQQGGRAVEWEVGDELTGRGDPRLLQVVLHNLLANALKFTGRCKDARIEFGQATQGAEQVFFVRDNGAGFEMAHANRLFGAFQRLHTPLEFPGTGIGLATVQRVIHRHGGRVWAEGQPEKGATFYFTLKSAK